MLGAGVTSFNAGDIILGGDGSDLITGNAGDDIIDGDKWLERADRRLCSQRYRAHRHADRPAQQHDDACRHHVHRHDQSRPVGIVRTIRTADGAGDTDIAAFADNQENYTLTANADGSITVAHTTVSDGLESDGVDRINNIRDALRSVPTETCHWSSRWFC